MTKKISDFTQEKLDLFSRQDGEPPSEEEEAAARSNENERMITTQEKKIRYAKMRAEIDKTKKMLAEKAKEAEKEKDGFFKSLKIR